MYKKIPIRIDSGKDPDTNNTCKILYLNNYPVNWWLDFATIEAIKNKIHTPDIDKILYKLLQHFMTVVRTGVQREHLSFSEFISSLEEGFIRTGVLE